MNFIKFILLLFSCVMEFSVVTSARQPELLPIILARSRKPSPVSSVSSTSKPTLNCLQNEYGPNCKYCLAHDTCTGGHYSCNDQTGEKNCLPGWKGDSCTQKDVALHSYFNLTCPDNNCRNQGICVSGTCCCQPGYTGVLCQIETIECQSRPCQNGGICLDLVGRYECSCRPGYTGRNCETHELITSPTTSHTPRCDAYTCANGGTCYQDLKSTYCVCPLWYSGKFCENHLASTNVSQNQTCPENMHGYNCSVHCVSHNSCYGGHYICDPIDGRKICLVGWMGINCDIRRLPQDLDPTCPSNLTCKNGGQCFQGSCCCTHHYSGQFCNIDSIGCLSSPCKNGARCVPISNQTSDYRCNCTNNFEGELCEIKVNVVHSVSTATTIHANNQSGSSTSISDIYSTTEYTHPESTFLVTKSPSTQAGITTSHSFTSDGDISSSPYSQTISKHYTKNNTTASINTPYSLTNSQEGTSTSSTVLRRQTTSTEKPSITFTFSTLVPNTTFLALSTGLQYTKLANTTQTNMVYNSNGSSHTTSKMAPITTTSSSIIINITSDLSTPPLGHTSTAELTTLLPSPSTTELTTPLPSPSTAELTTPLPSPSPTELTTPLSSPDTAELTTPLPSPSVDSSTSSSSVPGISQQTYISTKAGSANSVTTASSISSSVANTTLSTPIQTSTAYLDKTTLRVSSQSRLYLSSSTRDLNTLVSHPSTATLNSTTSMFSGIPSFTHTKETTNTSFPTSNVTTTNTSPNVMSTSSAYGQSEHSSLRSRGNYTSQATTSRAYTITKVSNIDTALPLTVSHLSSVASGQIRMSTSDVTTERLNLNTHSSTTYKTTTAIIGDKETTPISTESQISSLSSTKEPPVFLQSTNTGITHRVPDTTHVKMSSAIPVATTDPLQRPATASQSTLSNPEASHTTVVLLSSRTSIPTHAYPSTTSPVNYSKTVKLSSLNMSTGTPSVNSTGDNSTTSPLKSQPERSSSTWWIILIGILAGIVFLVAISIMFMVLFKFIRSTESRTLKRSPEEILKFDREHFSAVPEIDNPVYMDEPDFQDDSVKSDIYVVNR